MEILLGLFSIRFVLKPALFSWNSQKSVLKRGWFSIPWYGDGMVFRTILRMIPHMVELMTHIMVLILHIWFSTPFSNRFKVKDTLTPWEFFSQSHCALSSLCSKPWRNPWSTPGWWHLGLLPQWAAGRLCFRCLSSKTCGVRKELKLQVKLTVTDYCHSPGDRWEVKTVNYLQVCNAAKPSSFFQVCSICQEIIALCSKQEKVAQNSWKDMFVAKVPMKLRGLNK